MHLFSNLNLPFKFTPFIGRKIIIIKFAQIIFLPLLGNAGSLNKTTSFNIIDRLAVARNKYLEVEILRENSHL